ncbi:MAG: ChaN family lipoprotein [Crocinitomicaceae bacterium]|nr:ChaN family lipoprotein [Crocinitomicaceae bacterium]
MKNLLLFSVLILSSLSFSQDKSPYKIYNSKGKQVTYASMLKSLLEKNIVLFGEEHNCAIAHWLQLELTKDIDKKKNLVLGAEMFETDNQEQVNSYLNGTIDAKEFDSTARLWTNYETDYAPLLHYARDHQLNFTATNIPRKYASDVYKKGGLMALDSLSTEEKAWIAPLPIKFDSELPQYKVILEMMGDHGSPELVMAQAIKDATMAHFILKTYNLDHLFLHFNGSFHSDFDEGILWYLKDQKPDLNYGTISTVTQENIHKLEKENKGKADFIICVDVDMTTTY